MRGYRENRIIRDKGLLVSLEMHIPLVRQSKWADLLQVVPFADFDWGWNPKAPTPNPKELLSLGLGLQWMATLWPLQAKPSLKSGGNTGCSIEGLAAGICKTRDCICNGFYYLHRPGGKYVEHGYRNWADIRP